MPRGPAKKTTALIAATIDILQETKPASVRGICYQLFNRKLIPDMGKNSTGRVSRILTDARERGQVPWSWIVDETRPIQGWEGWDDPEQYMENIFDRYRKDRWASQPERLMVVSEKGTVGGILRPALAAYGVDFAVYHGFGSASAVHDLAKISAGDRRPLTLIYVGDHDPSGRYMSDEDLPGRLARYGGIVQIERLAVLPDQIVEQGLATFSAGEKKKDPRHAWFVREHGTVCCELDAMNAKTLRGLVEEAIRDHLDVEAWNRAASTEQAEKSSLSDFFESWPGMAA